MRLAEHRTVGTGDPELRQGGHFSQEGRLVRCTALPEQGWGCTDPAGLKLGISSNSLLLGSELAQNLLDHLKLLSLVSVLNLDLLLI